MAKKGEGTFSEVLKAQCIKNGKCVAIKCMKDRFDSLDQVNNLREIQAMRRLSPHGNIVKLLEVLYDRPTGRLALVFELMDMNIYELIRGRRHYVAEDRIKTYAYQLVKSMDHMHRNGIFHRDVKPENILITDDCLKLADFGSCRGVSSEQPYTEYVSTRWYRAPECLLTDGYYDYKMDMWGVGCVFFEMVSLFPLFPGANELDQIQKIHDVVGAPRPELLAKMTRRSRRVDFDFVSKTGSGIEKLIPHCTPECVDLITKLLAYDPDERLSARRALRHPYFRVVRQAETRRRAAPRPKHALVGADAAAHAPRAAKHTERAGRVTEAVVSARRRGMRIPRAPAPPAASAGTDAPRARRSGGTRAARGASEAPSVASSKDPPSVGARDVARVTRALPPSHAGSVVSLRASRRRCESGARAASGVSGASAPSAGGISRGGSAPGAGGSRFEGSAPVGHSAASASGGTRGGVVGKHSYHRGGGGGGGCAAVSDRRDARARAKRVSAYGQRR